MYIIIIIIIRDYHFRILETSEASDDTTSDFEEGASGLPKDSDWNVTLVDKSDILFLSDNSMDINNAKLPASCYSW